MENDLARKIKQLRLERDMTLEEVAKIVGVGKSTVRKWETGMIANMGRDKIALLANALGTTPTYLMGWTEPQESLSPSNLVAESEGEEFLLKSFRQLYEGEQEMYLEVLRARLKTQS